MRTAFIEELTRQARVRPDIFLVVGDLGYSVVEPFAKEFPDRFLNAGVAEQNMTGVAAGLASEGYHVFTYSIANFPTLRCLEQIRNDIFYHGLPVTIVAVGAGLAYGNLGYSHHAVEDVGIMRSFPSLAIYSQADPGETEECLQWLVAHPGPSYLRLGKAGEPVLHTVRGVNQGPMEIVAGKEDAAIMATGSILRVALQAASELKIRHGIELSVYSCPRLQPVDARFFESLQVFGKLFVLEEQLPGCGLSALLRQHLPNSLQIHAFCLPQDLLGKVGTQEDLLEIAGLTRERLVTQVLAQIKLYAKTSDGIPRSSPR